jgi:seryl-tRNA synthetase
MKQSHTIGFDSEAVRDFVYELLTVQDRRLSRSEILNMAAPSAEDVLALMDEYESDEARIAELEAESDRLQAELDDVILRDVYNLSDEDVAVVEEFLDVW